MIARSALVGMVVLVVAASLAAYSIDASSAGVQGSSTTSMTCTTKTATSGVQAFNGTFSANSSFPVRIDNVVADLLSLSNGTKTLQFEVFFTNVGNAALYVVRGCGSSLSSQLVGTSQVVKLAGGGPRCLCAEGLSAVTPGSSAASVDPGCWSAYSYRVLSTGTFTAKLVLHWSSRPDLSSSQNTTEAMATFTIG